MKVTIDEGRMGFTIIEIMFVIFIGSVLVAVSLSGFQRAQSRFAAVGAKTQFQALHQRARSRAVEWGETVVFEVEPDTDRVRTYTPARGDIETVDFGNEFGIDIQSSGGAFRQCMTPRGYADLNCGSLEAAGVTSIITNAVTVSFMQGADGQQLLMLPLGQIVG
jgi:type II secretory pathway pseudopilin PulG